MIAARLYGPYDIRVEDIPRPLARDEWVVLEVKAVGICGTDKAFYKGTYKLFKKPIVLGHEICGVVIDVGKNVPKDIVGQLFVSEINIVCNKCWFCTHDLSTHCPYREVLGITIDGGMAQYVTVPYRNLHRVELDPEIAIFVEPLAAVLQMIKLAPIKPGLNVAILGSGTIGILSIQVLKMFAPNNLVVITRPNSPKARYAKMFGADYVVSYDEALELKKRITPEGQGFDYVVEATGDPKGLDLAIELTRPRGIVAAKSTHGLPTTFNYTLTVVKEISIITSRCGPFKPAIRLLGEEKVRVKELITSRYRLTKAEEAFRRSLGRDQIKVVLKP